MTHRNGVLHPGLTDEQADTLAGLQNGDAPAPTTGGAILGQISIEDLLAGPAQPGRDATSRTRTLPNGDTYTFLLDDDGNIVKGSIEYHPRVIKEGPIIPLFVEEGPNGSTIVILSGGKTPLVFDAQVDLSQQFQLIPGTDTLVAREPDGTIRTIQRSQVPIQAIQTDSQRLSDGTIRQFFADGSHRDVAPLTQFQLGQIQERGGSQFVETSPGNFSRLPATLEPGQIVTLDGRQFIQQPDGSIQLLPEEQAPTLDQQIARALATGNVDAALALKDFKDRPTSLEAFHAAMQFAQSPGDVFSISNIARGITPIVAPEAGDTQRIALPPAFLQDSLSRVMNLFRGGTGTPNDFVSIIEQFATSENQAQRTAESVQKQLDQGRDFGETLASTDFENVSAATRTQVFGLLGTSAAPWGSDVATALAASIGLTGQQSRAEKTRFDDALELKKAEEALTTPPDTTTTPSLPAPPPEEAEVPATPPTPPDTTFGGSPLGPGPGGTTLPDDFIPDSTPIPLPPGEDDFFAAGGIFDDETAIVGENGPELLIAQPGARVIPLKGDDAAKIKAKFGIRGLAHGGTLDPLLPFGISQVLHGGSPEPTRRRLSTVAGIPILSAQARQRLLPEELDVFDRLRAEAGIPLGAFQQEQASATPGSVIQRAFRLTPRVAR